LKQTGYTSGSDNEDPTLGVCDAITQNSRKKEDENKIKVKLTEIGPRLNLTLHKVEEGFLKGNVIFHSYMKKSKKEIKELMDKLKEKRKLRKERKAVQDKNVEVKKIETESKMTEEEKREVERKKFKEEKMLNKKRKLEQEKKKKEADHQIMSKRSLKQLKNLKKGK